MSWWPWVRRRRARLREAPLPDAWGALVDANVPLATRLSVEERRTLDGLVQLFLDDKAFEGCGGLVLTDEIRVTIAAHACLLLVGLEVDLPYPGLDVIRVYPGTYRARSGETLGNIRIEGDSHRLGESSRHGYIVLAWDAVRRDATHPGRGHNVVLHEFAHQLDTADGVADGAPVLPRGLYGPWARVLGAVYAELQEDVASRRTHVLDAYGATNPAEFFAVATESFFDEPSELKRAEPRLYEVMARYYRQDPATARGSDGSP
ncbi:MAG: zinc-dependent peptidase [Myxococcota bacterium]